GEVEDHVLNVAQDLTVNLPAGNGGNNVIMRQNSGNIEVFDSIASAVIASSPLAFTNSVILTGSATDTNAMTVDYAFGGLFSLPGGLQLSGGTSGGDSLTVYGTSSTTVQYVSRGLALGNATMETQDGGSSNEIRFSNFNSLLSAGPVFEVVGALHIENTSTLGVGSSSPLKLGTLTTLD